jgi:hypothetical protein
MTIQLTQQEQTHLNTCFNGYVIDEAYTTPIDQTEGVTTVTLPTGRIATAIYHYYPDSLTVFKLEEAPPEPIPEPIVKLTTFLNANPDVKALLGL